MESGRVSRRPRRTGTHYGLFATASRGPNTEGSCLIYLPPDYETAKTRRYPVLYFLHGGGGS
jgi:dipeptidyl aminopeptidase/acylaminoacyl peptidase